MLIGCLFSKTFDDCYNDCLYGNVYKTDNVEMSEFRALLEQKNESNQTLEEEYKESVVYGQMRSYFVSDIHEKINSLEDFIKNYDSVKIPSFENFYKENYGSNDAVSFEEEFQKYLELRECDNVEELKSVNKSGYFYKSDAMKAADMFILSGIASTNGRGVSTQGEPLHKLIENSLTFDKKCELAYKYSQEFSGTEDVDYQAENIQTFKKILSNLIKELDETFKDLKAMLEGMINYTESSNEVVEEIIEVLDEKNEETVEENFKDDVFEDIKIAKNCAMYAYN